MWENSKSLYKLNMAKKLFCPWTALSNTSVLLCRIYFRIQISRNLRLKESSIF